MPSAFKILFALFVLLFATLWIVGRGHFGVIDGAEIEPVGAERALPLRQEVMERQSAAIATVDAPAQGQILFGDLHVHTTLSSDAFMMNLPMMGGSGAMTPADACDFARHCAALDFWSINDHANSLYPEDWQNTVDSIRACNERASDPNNPDTVAFLGWEWTQAGLTPDGHFGHKNVVLGHTDDERIPARPIAAKFGPLLLGEASPILRGGLSLLDRRFNDLSRRIVEQTDAPVCGDGHVRDLEKNCREVAPTPPELFRKLDEWGHEAIVIPHGTAWGVYTPPTSDWAKQLKGDMQDPDWQSMLEVYSGHGDSEVYRDWRGSAQSASGTPVCPPEEPGYLPPCRQAGRIIMDRCLAEGTSDRECEGRAELARQNAIAAGKDYVLTVADSTPEEWKDAGQCRDCNQPSFNYVPTGSAQYIAALGNFDEDPDRPRRFRMGFMASSDNHSARPGTGYKELIAMTDGGFDDPSSASPIADRIRSGADKNPNGKSAHSKAVTVGETSPITALADVERTGSFQYTGGLVAVHAGARDRGSIWKALKENSVYGTSGPRILLWFDLITAEGDVPMGGERILSENPTFRVRAAGSFAQKPGCPADATSAIDADSLARLCLGECYHPSDQRRPIERIDVIRIRPQNAPGEDIGQLVEDPWRSFECDGDTDGCVATFTDDEFIGSGRDAVYYARVFESPIPTVNASILGCERDAEGRCTSISTCSGDDDCLHPDRPRAWSSPIYVDHPTANRTR